MDSKTVERFMCGVPLCDNVGVVDVKGSWLCLPHCRERIDDINAAVHDALARLAQDLDVEPATLCP